MCASSVDLFLEVVYSGKQGFGFCFCIAELFYLMYNERNQPGVILVNWDFHFLLLINRFKTPIENMCYDLLYLCIFMDLSATEEII